MGRKVLGSRASCLLATCRGSWWVQTRHPERLLPWWWAAEQRCRSSPCPARVGSGRLGEGPPLQQPPVGHEQNESVPRLQKCIVIVQVGELSPQIMLVIKITLTKLCRFIPADQEDQKMGQPCCLPKLAAFAAFVLFQVEATCSRTECSPCAPRAAASPCRNPPGLPLNVTVTFLLFAGGRVSRAIPGPSEGALAAAAAREGLAGDGRAEQVPWEGQRPGAGAGAALGASHAGRDFCKAGCPQAPSLGWTAACPPSCRWEMPMVKGAGGTCP